MDAAFWLQRWQEGRIGFHRTEVMPLLSEHWPTLDLPKGSRVLVPLAGKSLDMIWLAAQGHRVLGVELSEMAVEQFFREHALSPSIMSLAHGRRYSVDGIDLICGDIFELDDSDLSDCVGVYDRAALIALPEAMRRRYVDEIYTRLPAGCRGLLITLEYPQAEKAGPPFSVDEQEVKHLFDAQWHVECVVRRDILASEPGFVAEGVTALSTAVYRMQRRA